MALAHFIRCLKGSEPKLTPPKPKPLILPWIKLNCLQGLSLANESQKPRDFCIIVEDQDLFGTGAV